MSRTESVDDRDEELAELRDRVADLEDELHHLRNTPRPPQMQTVRKRSETMVGSLPLWEIALGPDPEQDEIRGHARAVFAIGDIATGVVALGGQATGGIAIGGLTRGFIAIGGLSLGVFSVGGCAVGIIAAIGGCAAAGLVAVGGVAVAAKAFGGTALSFDPQIGNRLQQFVDGLLKK